MFIYSRLYISVNRFPPSPVFTSILNRVEVSFGSNEIKLHKTLSFLSGSALQLYLAPDGSVTSLIMYLVDKRKGRGR